MSNTPIAAAAGAARQRLASSLSALQQDPKIPPAVMDIVAGVARAMGPLFQVERGTGAPQLLFQARTALQETLSRMQTVDQSYPGVSEATAAIANALGMIFTAIRDNAIADPSAPAQASPLAQAVQAPIVQAPPVQAPPAKAPVAAAQPVRAKVPRAAPPDSADRTIPEGPPMVLMQPAAQPIALVQPTAQPMPLVHQAPSRLSAPSPPPAASGVAAAPVNLPTDPAASERRRPLTVFPETAAKVPQGPNGLPRLEALVDVHSETNFFTNFFGDIRDHGGIFVETYNALAIGSACEVVITFPGSFFAEIRGVVRWRRDPSTEGTVAAGLGIEITQANDEAWRLISRYMAKRTAIIYEV